MVVQRAHDDLPIIGVSADEPVGERPAAVGADRPQRVEPARARPEHGHGLVADEERPPLAQGDPVDGAEPRLDGLLGAAHDDTPSRLELVLMGTCGSGTSGSASWNWPGVASVWSVAHGSA